MNRKETLDIIAKAANTNNKHDKTRTLSTGKIYHDLFRHDIRTADELVARLGRQWKHNLANLLTLCRIVTPETHENTYNEIAVACTAPIMLQHFGCIKSASNIIKLAERIDLLFCTCKKYYFNNNKKDSQCRGYIVNKSMTSLIQDCCILYNVGVENNKKKKKSASENNKDSSSLSLNNLSPAPPLSISCNLRKVRFSCRMQLSNELTDKDIRSALYQKYPLLQHYQNLAKQLNEKYYADSPKLQIRFSPTIHRSDKGYITKIGIRAASSVCGLPKAVDEASEVPTRGDFFRTYFGNTPVYEYDIKSSIYRVAHLMRHHEWLDDSVDFYERMAGREFVNAEQRANFKRLSMSLYFGGTAREVTHHLIDRCPHLRAYPKEEIVTAIAEAQERMFAVVGESMDTEVFFHESCICMDLLARLLKRGLRVVQVYDGFYSDDPRLGEFCTEWLPEVATDYWVSCAIERAYQDDKNPTC